MKLNKHGMKNSENRSKWSRRNGYLRQSMKIYENARNRNLIKENQRTPLVHFLIGFCWFIPFQTRDFIPD